MWSRSSTDRVRRPVPPRLGSAGAGFFVSSVVPRISRGAPIEGRTPSRIPIRRRGPIPPSATRPRPRRKSAGQEVRQEGAVEAVDGRGPQAHVEVAAALIAPERRGASYILAGSVGVHDGIAERRGVAKAEV